jgi:VanZ like family/Concanavalin A-like lectin/glucanases superfamily
MPRQECVEPAPSKGSTDVSDSFQSLVEWARRILSHEKILRIACALVLAAILIAALWPFHAPKNGVSWLNNRNGLLFGDYGSILSSGEFKVTGLRDGRCSLEIWVQPVATFDSSDIVAFSTPPNPLQFEVAQSGDDLFVIRDILDAQRHRSSAHIAIDHVFRGRNKLLITITSGQQGTAVYLDGMLVKVSPQFAITSRDFSGRLVVGNSPVQNNTWGGQLLGLGISDRELTAAQVLQHYNAWTNGRGLRLAGEEGTRSLYLFNESMGRIVHNQVASEPDLYIPEHYFVLHPQFLTAPWKDFSAEWVYWENVILNVGAFIPLGLLFSAYFSSVRQLKRATEAAIFLGFALSFTIEIMQAFLPTRDSGMTDIITNTSGTALGAALYVWLTKQTSLGRVEISTRLTTAEEKDSTD